MSKRRGGHGSGHAGGQERWLLTYADLITLLLVFFVVLYAMSSPVTHKYDELTHSLNSAFHITSGASNSVLSGNPAVMTGSTAFIPEMQALAQMQDNLDKTLSKSHIGTNSVTTTINQRGLVISLANSAFFDSGSATFKPAAKIILKSIIPTLKGSGRALMVEGYTDNTPIHTSQFPSNWELSTARATTVVRTLITDEGLSPKRLSAAGYGEYYPLVPNTTAANRAKNRRVDIVILRSDLKGAHP
jgi:chemotaxis protein MotB